MNQKKESNKIDWIKKLSPETKKWVLGKAFLGKLQRYNLSRGEGTVIGFSANDIFLKLVKWKPKPNSFFVYNCVRFVNWHASTTLAYNSMFERLTNAKKAAKVVENGIERPEAIYEQCDTMVVDIDGNQIKTRFLCYAEVWICNNITYSQSYYALPCNEDHLFH